MRLLIATDGSRYAREAARFGALLADALDAEWSLVGVAESFRDRGEIHRHLDELARELRPDEPPIITMRQGNPTSEILSEIEESEADLLVVGARGRSSVSRWLLGDTAQQLASRAPIPLVIVRKGRPAIDKILVCTAGGEGGRRDAEYGGMIAAQTGAEMVILHVLSQVPVHPGAGRAAVGRDAAWHLEHQTTEGVHLDELVEIAQAQGAAATPKIREGLVVDEICAEARGGDYDLVTIGAHRSQGLMRFLLDDITAEIISRLYRPVLIVR